MDLSLAVVSYNTKDWLERSLTSVFRDTTGITFDVFVVDNASIDGSAEMVRQKFPQVHLIANPTNEYITKPYNLVIRQSTGRYILIADSDLEYPDNALGRMVGFLDSHSDIGMLCAMIRRPDQSLDMVYNRDNTLIHAFLNRTLLSKLLPGAARKLEAHFMYSGWDRLSSQEIEVADVCLMVRRKTLDEVGLYDEALKLYYTQNDLCLRARAKGWKVYYWSDVYIVHAKSQSVGRTPFQTIAEIYRSDMKHYYRTQYSFIAANSYIALYTLTRWALQFAKSAGLYHPKKSMIYGIDA